MARYSYIPNRVIDTNGIADGASMYFYLSGTTTPISIFSDQTLTTQLTNPYIVEAGAAVPTIYYEGNSNNVRVKVVGADGNTISDDDPVIASLTDQLEGAEAAQIAAEAAQAAAAADRQVTEVAAAEAVAAAADAQLTVQQVADALATGTVSDLVGTRIYSSRAALNADLVPADNLYALVVGDPTPANNDLYQKNGATTVGSWDGPLGLFAAASALAQAAEAGAVQAKDDTVDLLDTATAGMEFIGATANPVIAGETRTIIGSLTAKDANDFYYALMAFVQSADSVDIVSEPLRRYVSSLAVAWPDYLQFIVHGQSLGEGSESLTSTGTLVTTTDQGWGSKRFSRGGRTWDSANWPTVPANRSGMTSLVALTGQIAGAVGEQIANGFADAFKAKIAGRYGFTDPSLVSPEVLFTSAIRGGTRLTAISSEDTGNTTYSTSTTNLTIGSGSKTFTVGTGLTLPTGAVVRLANNATGTLYDFSPYMEGTVTSYNSGSGELIVNVTSFSLGGQVSHNNWRLLRDAYSAPGGFWPTMLADVQAANDLATSEGKRHAVGAFVHMQGERNSDLKIYEYDTATVPMSAAVASYKAKFVDYADEVQSEIIAITGQRSVPFLTYQTLANPAAQAQLDAAIENPGLITMVGPTYAYPRAWNGSRGTGGSQIWGDPIHLAADASRMFGEMVAKVRWSMEGGERFQPIRPLSAVKVDATTFDVTFHVPKPPLVLETDFIAQAAGYGFIVYPGDIDTPGTAAAIASATVIAADTIRFTTSVNIPANGKLWGGVTPFCNLGVNPAIIATGTGVNSPSGFPTKTITIAGDQRDLLGPLTNEGAFSAHKLGATGTRGTIRGVALDSGNTVLTYETRESGGTFVVTDQLVFARGTQYTNLRDSDTATSIYTFADTGYPARLGQPYPLWNWCALFAAFPITGA